MNSRGGYRAERSWKQVILSEIVLVTFAVRPAQRRTFGLLGDDYLDAIRLQETMGLSKVAAFSKSVKTKSVFLFYQGLHASAYVSAGQARCADGYILFI